MQVAHLEQRRFARCAASRLLRDRDLARARAARCRPPGSRSSGPWSQQRDALAAARSATSIGSLARRRPASRSGSAGGSGTPAADRSGSAARPGCSGARSVLQRDGRAQELARVRVRGLGEDLAGVALLDDLARVHHRDPVAGLGDDPEVVGDQEQRRVEVLAAGRRGCRGSAPRRSRRAPWSARRRRPRSGCRTSASAIMIRWRMPPENSCGYCLNRVGGMPIPASASSERVAHLVLARGPGSCALERLEEVLLDRDQRVEPGHRLLEDQPELRARGSSRSSARLELDQVAAAVAHLRRRRRRSRAAGRAAPRPSVDLPQPDSPTRPSVSPGADLEARRRRPRAPGRPRSRTRRAGR